MKDDDLKKIAEDVAYIRAVIQAFIETSTKTQPPPSALRQNKQKKPVNRTGCIIQLLLTCFLILLVILLNAYYPNK